MKNIKIIMKYLSENVAHILSLCDDLANIDEVRLRINKPLVVTKKGLPYILSTQGKYIKNPANSYIIKENDIDYSFKKACNYSWHSYEREISNGFLTIEGGNRVGICGCAVSGINCDEISTLKYISSLNFRVAREVRGCSDKIAELFGGGQLSSLLIVGAPSSGKTTLIRDLTRKLSENYAISLIDERNEISATLKGVAQNDVGINTDIFANYPKKVAIETAIRVMSPQILVCDEISKYDIAYIEQAINCGCKLICTVHSGSIEEVLQKEFIKTLVEKNAFKNIVFLGNKEKTGEVLDIKTC